jgi:histidinol-phosphate/aromatic aminotransferase/cobyric acid decarboxylase-like protein
MTAYDKPPELYDGLRLHQNENTGGCSPRVLEALAKLRPDEVGFYPPYAAATRACAEYLGVDPGALALTNGLDEGIMGIAVAYLRPPVADRFRKRSSLNRRSKSFAWMPRPSAADSPR